MSIYRVVTCDQCGETDAFFSYSVQDIKRIKRAQGWSFGKRDLCPTCKRLEKKGN